jgi:hypothetical protein
MVIDQQRIFSYQAKILIGQSNNRFNTEENYVNLFKEVNSSVVSIDFNQPTIYSNQNYEASSLVDIPIQHADCLTALRETLRFNHHCTESKSSCVQALFIQWLSNNPICRK